MTSRCSVQPIGEIRVYEYVYEYVFEQGIQPTQPYSYTYSYTQLFSMTPPVDSRFGRRRSRIPISPKKSPPLNVRCSAAQPARP